MAAHECALSPAQDCPAKSPRQRGCAPGVPHGGHGVLWLCLPVWPGTAEVIVQVTLHKRAYYKELIFMSSFSKIFTRYKCIFHPTLYLSVTILSNLFITLPVGTVQLVAIIVLKYFLSHLV